MRQPTALFAACALCRRSFTTVSACRFRESAPLSVSAAEEDYYALLLTNPTPNSSRKSIKALHGSKADKPSSSSPSVPSASAAKSTDRSLPETRILFSGPLAGPSARMRGISRAEQGLGRPPEPDNCCMSGCVNCVWDAYREEVEEWAAGRRRREADLRTRPLESRLSAASRVKAEMAHEGAIGDSDEIGRLGAYEDVDLDDEGGLFDGVPVGIKEFMKQEKRLREKREREEG